MRVSNRIIPPSDRGVPVNAQSRKCPSESPKSATARHGVSPHVLALVVALTPLSHPFRRDFEPPNNYDVQRKLYALPSFARREPNGGGINGGGRISQTNVFVHRWLATRVVAATCCLYKTATPIYATPIWFPPRCSLKATRVPELRTNIS